ncbi:TetR/AcrR family transcriptional regulator [Kineococcus rhizosphaerae]|uniref:TetR family transcriptional regulator n=1 Tax=Kineococcus rhizosphaerae TaxID=559628 RepID=A0A2T0R5V0_9ACTN|nr:TetR/AcrR family transcriptional regulator [Kineococcus rhizosphaerae]PRY16129.1 TetR family transcriptional regulator [Kineococcus rhizosphaerae]
MAERKVRADAQRNLDALLVAARDVFAVSGVDAPVREIAAKAGVGVGTVYRHFPQRSDLVTAVFRHEVDACAEQAPLLAAQHPPFEALRLWLLRFTGFVAAKRGLAAALHSGDPAFEPLPAYFSSRFEPALEALLEAAEAAGEIRRPLTADELLATLSRLSTPDQDYTERVVDLLLDGLRHRP